MCASYEPGPTSGPAAPLLLTIESATYRDARPTLETMLESGLAPGRWEVETASFGSYAPGPGLTADGNTNLPRCGTIDLKAVIDFTYIR